MKLANQFRCIGHCRGPHSLRRLTTSSHRRPNQQQPTLAKMTAPEGQNRNGSVLDVKPGAEVIAPTKSVDCTKSPLRSRLAVNKNAADGTVAFSSAGLACARC